MSRKGVSTQATPLDVDIAAEGITLIEASAGSGKTRALTTLVARLLVEEGRPLDDILTVTFTRAATAELLERVRRTLVAVHLAMRPGGTGGDDGGDPQARELLDRWKNQPDVDSEQAALRIETALHDIDRANVHTIHGFCQRALVDFAFECGLPFSFEVSGDDGNAVLKTAVSDFWQRRARSVSPTFAGCMAVEKFLPDQLTGWVSALRGKPGLVVEGGPEPGAPIPLEASETAWREAFEKLRDLWQTHKNDFDIIMYSGAALNRATYKPATVREKLDVIDFRLRAREPGLWDEKDAAWFGREKVSGSCKKDHVLPDNPLFDAFDELAGAIRKLRATYKDWMLAARREILDETSRIISRRVRDERRLDFDDLLFELHRALLGKSGSRLAARLRERYPVALIDEYQDTDPLQARIFADIYGKGASKGGAGGTLFMVGDPKQSIYRFRGAEIFAYLSARNMAHTRIALDHNWRSTPDLVDAVNTVFGTTLPFVFPEIEFTPATAGRSPDKALRIDGDDGPPFHVWYFPSSTRKLDDRLIAADVTAGKIAGLLDLAGRGKATLEGRPLGGSDIAVLVRNRFQGRPVVEALRERGVRCIEIEDASVFRTREAEQLDRLLWVLAEPGRENRERAALAGDLFGFDSRGLLSLAEDDKAWGDQVERLRAWRRTWESKGIGTVLRRIIEIEGGGKRLLRYRDGPRRLTNVRHLADLLRDAEAEHRFAPAGLAAWLSRCRQDAGAHKEDAQLRLESDEDLVRILTMHSSKGLEFPIVFCPCVWEDTEVRKGRSDKPVNYHRFKDGHHVDVLDLVPAGRARECAKAESFAESVRMFYVALTRAREQCVIIWKKPSQSAAISPLIWLLHRDWEPSEDEMADWLGEGGRQDRDRALPELVLKALDAAENRLKEALTEGKWKLETRELAKTCPNGIQVMKIDEIEVDLVDGMAAPEDPERLAPRVLARPLRRTRQMTSFSALSQGHGEAPPHVLPGAERPDHDETAGVPADGDERDLEAEAPDEFSPYTFPKGMTVGRCLHRIFERLDEDAGADPAAVCEDSLREYGLDPKWQDAARTMVENTRSVLLEEPGHGGFRLADGSPRLIELEFCFPVNGLDRSRLAELLSGHGYPCEFPGTAGLPAIDGFLRGFIDLATEHAGRWYILDYKSNWLGNGPGDYGPAALAEAMGSRGYALQYLIYLVALHRHLGARLPGYDYDRHVGGAFYLFLRGIDPEAGMERGVFHDRPGIEFITMLDDCFRGAP